jgi:nucleotide-binding universal stress UspA family protein
MPGIISVTIPQEAVIRAVRAAEALGDEAVEIVTLHVNGSALLQLHRPQSNVCIWKEIRREGDAVVTILDAAQEADLVVMATEGRHGFVDAMRGSVTERVVHGATCLVLTVPAPRDNVTPAKKAPMRMFWVRAA